MLHRYSCISSSKLYADDRENGIIFLACWPIVYTSLLQIRIYVNQENFVNKHNTLLPFNVFPALWKPATTVKSSICHMWLIPQMVSKHISNCINGMTDRLKTQGFLFADLEFTLKDLSKGTRSQLMYLTSNINFSC